MTNREASRAFLWPSRLIEEGQAADQVASCRSAANSGAPFRRSHAGCRAIGMSPTPTPSLHSRGRSDSVGSERPRSSCEMNGCTSAVHSSGDGTRPASGEDHVDRLFGYQARFSPRCGRQSVEPLPDTGGAAAACGSVATVTGVVLRRLRRLMIRVHHCRSRRTDDRRPRR